MLQETSHHPSLISILVQLCRPKTLFLVLSSVILGLSLAKFDGYFDPFIATCTLACAILLQIGANIANDYYDGIEGIDDKRIGPLRVTASKLLPAHQVKKIFMLTLLLAFLVGIPLIMHGGQIIFLIGILSLAIAYGYAGGPFPLSHLPFGEALAFIFFGPIAVIFTYYLQAEQFSSLVLIASLGPGFLAASVMGINNYRDRDSDQEKDKLTLATLCSPFWARTIALSFIDLSLLVCIIVAFKLKSYYPLLPAGIALLFFIPWWKLFTTGDKTLCNKVLAITSFYSFLYSISLSISFFL